MDSRQRVETALAHKEPDRVPFDYWATPEITGKLMEYFSLCSEEELLEKLDIDFRYIPGPIYTKSNKAVREDGTIEDHWGVPRKKVQAGHGSYWEVTEFPLGEASSLEEIRNYQKWPDPDWFNYECVRKQVAEAKATGKVVVFMGDRLNRCAQLKPAMYIRGIEQIFVDLAISPDIAEYLFGRISDFYLEYARRTFEAAEGNIDIFFTGDDFGAQNSLLISPDMWRSFLKPRFKAFIDLGKKYGCKVAHHSCGVVMPLIEDMIECGLDILNPLQPEVAKMDRREIKTRFGDRLSFHGSISIQKTLPFGTRDDIREEVKERIETLASGGGFILCTTHNIQPDMPIENVITLFEAYREFGRY